MNCKCSKRERTKSALSFLRKQINQANLKNTFGKKGRKGEIGINSYFVQIKKGQAQLALFCIILELHV